jgi:hypothetical protein
MTYTANRLKANLKRKLWDFDPDSTAATVVGGTGGWHAVGALGGTKAFLAALFRSVGTGSVSSFIIQAATSSTGASAATVVSHALGTAPDAVGDQVYLEASDEQIRAALANATHVAVKIGLATSTDECVVLTEYEPSFKADGLTADIIA